MFSRYFEKSMAIGKKDLELVESISNAEIIITTIYAAGLVRNLGAIIDPFFFLLICIQILPNHGDFTFSI